MRGRQDRKVLPCDHCLLTFGFHFSSPTFFPVLRVLLLRFLHMKIEYLRCVLGFCGSVCVLTDLFFQVRRAGWLVAPQGRKCREAIFGVVCCRLWARLFQFRWRVSASFSGGDGFLGRYRFLTDVRESFGPIEGSACERPSSTRFLAPGDFGPWVLPTVESVGAR